MTTTFLVRMDMGDEGEIVWWADTNAITGFSAAAGSLAELRELIDEAVALYLAPDAKFELDLVAPDKGVESEVVLAAAPSAVADGSSPPAHAFRQSMVVH